MKPIYLIAGLGNPGPDYAGTRHNAGFDVANAFASVRDVQLSADRKLFSKIGTISTDDAVIVLCLPQTFMNASGKAVHASAAYFKVPLERILVSVDDADLDVGTIRLRVEGSSGGHHGIESIEKHFASREFARQKIGIGRASNERNIAGYVLSRFHKSEQALYQQVVARAVEQIECWIKSGSEAAISGFNGKIKIDNKL